jgi:hypothetical protein
MLLVGQEIALTFDFCSTATLTLAKGGIPPLDSPFNKKQNCQLKKLKRN